MNSAEQNPLTPKEEAFCLKYTEMNSASEAFRASYDVGSETKAKTVNKMAFRLLHKGEVRGRLEQLREVNRAQLAITIQTLTREIEDAQTLAYKKENPSALINGIALKAKLHGLLVDKSKQKVEHTVNRDLDTLMAKIDGQSRTLQKRSKNDH